MTEIFQSYKLLVNKVNLLRSYSPELKNEIIALRV